MKQVQIFFLLPQIIVLTVFSSCSNSEQNGFVPKTFAQNDKIHVIRNVNIIPMTESNEVIENASLVIQNQEILSINRTIPAEAHAIDGKGKWLIPGLIDMHVHNLADINLGSNYPTKGAAILTDTERFMLLYIARMQTL